MHIHIVGICGTFMGGVAQLAKALGHRVTGCDKAVYPPMSDALKSQGIDIIEGYDASQIELNPDYWIIGNAISRGNPLLEAILNKGLPYTSGPAWMGEYLLTGRAVLSVAGTHGKTTTTAMLIHILEEMGICPGYLVGGVPLGQESSAKLGQAKAPFVIEADEYDTAFFDKRSKFVHYRTKTAILNNLEYDHADIFENLGAIEKQFHHLVRTIPSEGLIVMNNNAPALERVLDQGVWTPVVRFNDDKGWHIHEGHIFCADKDYGELVLTMPGAHNQSNALAAILAAGSVGVSVSQAILALASFKGVKRRMEIKGEVNGIRVMDDFAHHPSAIEQTLLAAQALKPNPQRVLIALEPRSNTMKLGTMKAMLPHALLKADRVFCFEGAGVHWSTSEALLPLGEKSHSYQNLEMMVSDIVKEAKSGDVILCMSNGSFGGIHQKLLTALANKKG